MTFTFQFEMADWVAFNLHYMKNSRQYRRRRFQSCLILLFSFLILGLVLSAKDRDWESAVAFSVIGIVVFFLYPRVHDHSVLKRANKMMADPDNAKAFGRWSVTLSATGVQISAPGIDATIAWNSIRKLEETQDHAFLYVSEANAITIPRLSLEGASFADVKAALREYTKGTSLAERGIRSRKDRTDGNR